MARKNAHTNAKGEWVFNVSLPNDYGEDIEVTGNLVAEDMHFNNTNGKLTVEKVFKDQDGLKAYSIISAIGNTRDRCAYTISEQEDRSIISNGSITLDVSTDELYELLSYALQEEAASRTDDTLCRHIRNKLAVGE